MPSTRSFLIDQSGLRIAIDLGGGTKLADRATRCSELASGIQRSQNTGIRSRFVFLVISRKYIREVSSRLKEQTIGFVQSVVFISMIQYSNDVLYGSCLRGHEKASGSP